MFCEWYGESEARSSLMFGIFLQIVGTFFARTSWGSFADAAVLARVDCLEGTLVGHIAPERVSRFWINIALVE